MKHLFKFIFLGFIILIFMACANTRPAKFYTLNTISDSNETDIPKTAVKDIGVGILPVNIPDALDRPQIVIRIGPNEMELAEFDRWSGSFKDSFTRTLSENLSILLPSDHVFIYPWKESAPIEYHLEIDLIRFDGMLNKNATLVAHWSVIRNDRKESVVVKRTIVTEAVSGSDYGALVAAQSRALAHLSHKIANAVKNIAFGIPEMDD